MNKEMVLQRSTALSRRVSRWASIPGCTLPDKCSSGKEEPARCLLSGAGESEPNDRTADKQETESDLPEWLNALSDADYVPRNKFH
jgi:hypothetical protein